MNRITALVAALAALAAGQPLSAQTFSPSQPLGPPRAFGGLAAVGALPQGEFADSVDVGFGLAGHFVYQLDRGGLLGLRLDGGFVNYGHETQRVPLSSTVGGRVLVDLTTTNNIFFVGAGPQLGVPTGRLRPYANGSVGIAYFQTESSVEGTRSDEPFASTTNFDDLTFAYGGAAGLYVPLRTGETPISLDVGVRYHDNGRARYLREGSIRDDRDGSVTFQPIESEANLVTFHVGVSVALRSHDDRGDRPRRDGRRRRR